MSSAKGVKDAHDDCLSDDWICEEVEEFEAMYIRLSLTVIDF